MRQFLWGLVFGAAAMYYYTYYGHQLIYAKQQIDSWRDQAVSETSGYSGGRKK